MRRYLVILAMLLAMVASCDVHQFPEGEADVELTLHLVYNGDLPQYKIIDYTTRADEISDEDGEFPYNARYVVEFYPAEERGYSKTSCKRVVFTGPDVVSLDTTVTVLLPPAKYRAVAWTDFVEDGSEEDLFWNPSDFNEITFADRTYEGGNDFKSCFNGDKEIDISMYTRNGETHSEVINLSRPVAKFNFIATDRNDFILMMLRMFQEQGITKADVDLSTYKVLFQYSQYLPCAFNALSNKAIDSVTGVWFNSDIKELEDGDVEMGFDYVLVNGEESKVIVSVGIYDAEGEEIGTVRDIQVPLKRSHLTTVRGKFLTSGSSSGVSIDPTYDGEFNIFIQ